MNKEFVGYENNKALLVVSKNNSKAKLQMVKRMYAIWMCLRDIFDKKDSHLFIRYAHIVNKIIWL